MTRQYLPARRGSETFTIPSPNLSSPLRYNISVGRDNADTIKEVFISCHKAASEMDIAGRDIATIISIALQHGVNIAELAGAVCRDDEGVSQGIAGAVLDAVMAGNDGGVVA